MFAVQPMDFTDALDVKCKRNRGFTDGWSNWKFDAAIFLRWERPWEALGGEIGSLF